MPIRKDLKGKTSRVRLAPSFDSNIVHRCAQTERAASLAAATAVLALAVPGGISAARSSRPSLT